MNEDTDFLSVGECLTEIKVKTWSYWITANRIISIDAERKMVKEKRYRNQNNGIN